MSSRLKISVRYDLIMNIYLDIDRVILTKDKKPSIGVVEFLEKATSNHSVYWLTTHCKGDAENAVQYLKKVLPVEANEYLEKIQSTNWDVLKTDAVDFSKEFLWFDDYLMDSERKILENEDSYNKLVVVDLKTKPDFLKQYMKML